MTFRNITYSNRYCAVATIMPSRGDTPLLLFSQSTLLLLLQQIIKKRIIIKKNKRVYLCSLYIQYNSNTRNRTQQKCNKIINGKDRLSVIRKKGKHDAKIWAGLYWACLSHAFSDLLLSCLDVSLVTVFLLCIEQPENWLWLWHHHNETS